MTSYRILHIARPANGGLRQYVTQLLASERRLGLQSSLLAPPGDWDEKKQVSITHLPVADRLHGQDLITALRLRRIVNARRPDLIHAHGFKPALITAAAGLRSPTVATLHGYPAVHRRRQRSTASASQARRLAPAVHEQVIAWSLRRFQALMTVSSSLSQYIEDLAAPAEPPITSVTLSLAPQWFKPVPKHEEHQPPLIGVVGRLAVEKGIDRLIRALPVITQYEPEAEVAVLGTGPELDRLQALAARQKVRDRIRFHGFVSNPYRWYRRFDVLVTPSRSEGLSLATLQAMACGVPVVAHPTGGLLDLLGRRQQRGQLVDTTRPAALAQAVQRAVQEMPEQSQQLAAARRHAARHHGPGAAMHSVLPVYRQVLNR